MAEDLAAFRILRAADDVLHAENLAGELAGEVVAVVALGDGDEGVRLAGAGALQDLGIHAVADGHAPAESRRGGGGTGRS